MVDQPSDYQTPVPVHHRNPRLARVQHGLPIYTGRSPHESRSLDSTSLFYLDPDQKTPHFHLISHKPPFVPLLWRWRLRTNISLLVLTTTSRRASYYARNPPWIASASSSAEAGSIRGHHKDACCSQNELYSELLHHRSMGRPALPVSLQHKCEVDGMYIFSGSIHNMAC